MFIEGLISIVLLLAERKAERQIQQEQPAPVCYQDPEGLTCYPIDPNPKKGYKDE